MRLNFLVMLAVLVLPLFGCGKKESDGVASNNSSNGTNADSEGMDPMMDEGMDSPGGHNDGTDPMMEEGMDPMMEEGMDPMMEEG
ncbi:MAG: hypothetical protein KDA84_19080, partial [Planctomycetaceae bacterium]|nr:hypothetical protein [Planctomycetaceae bacterium]